MSLVPPEDVITTLEFRTKVFALCPEYFYHISERLIRPANKYLVSEVSNYYRSNTLLPNNIYKSDILVAAFGGKRMSTRI